MWDEKGQLLANPKSLPRQSGQLQKFPWGVSTAMANSVQSSQVFKIFRNCSESSRHNFLSFGLIPTTNDNAFHKVYTLNYIHN